MNEQMLQLRGGADPLREAHRDWLVAAGVSTTDGKAKTICVIAQEQHHTDLGQRILQIELRPVPDGVTGVLVLPFGLALQHGAVLSLDDTLLTDALPFRTALPIGSCVDIDLDTATVARMRNAKNLQVKVTSFDTGQTLSFAISLNGFATALDTAIAVTGH